MSKTTSIISALIFSTTAIVFGGDGTIISLDVPLKMERLKQWCKDINKAQSEIIYDYLFVDQEGFNKYKPKNFEALMSGFRDYKD